MYNYFDNFGLITNIKYTNFFLFCSKVPITIDVEVPNDLHRLLAGQKRRELMQTYDVHILMPPPNEEASDIVKVITVILLITYFDFFY